MQDGSAPESELAKAIFGDKAYITGSIANQRLQKFRRATDIFDKIPYAHTVRMRGYRRLDHTVGLFAREIGIVEPTASFLMGLPSRVLNRTYFPDTRRRLSHLVAGIKSELGFGD